MCLKHGWRLMLVHNKEPQSKHVRSKGLETDSCEKMDARFEQHNTTFHATRAFVR